LLLVEFYSAAAVLAFRFLRQPSEPANRKAATNGGLSATATRLD
jgi:hypothetical protein